MRCHGPIDRVVELGANAHACWAYDSGEGFRSAACEFLAEGLEAGQRLLLATPGGEEELRDLLSGLGRVAELEEAGTLELRPLGGRQPEEFLAGLGDECAAALSAGHAGLRVVTEITAIVADPDRWSDYARLEAVADRLIARNPVSMLCCLDRRELADALVEDLARVHPCTNVRDDLGGFRIFAGDRTMILDGEVDTFSRDAFHRLLDHTIPDDGESTLDLAGVGFIDHVGVLALASRADAVAAAGGTMRITGAPHPVTRMCDLLGVRLPLA
ncbi:MAG TPA: MEDS domain-containing protein [Solirubrobacterales bacterium]|nr:MEDS domain-containing protein [Solirubrobacterales bacterium]